METTVIINEELLERAEDLTGLHDIPEFRMRRFER